jgi:hypothetical protein
MRLITTALAAMLALALATGPTSANDLSATVTRSQRIPYTGFVEFLMVVDNKSNRVYQTTDWSCVFFDGDTPVYENSYFVNKVLANAQTVKSQIAMFDSKFTAIACRLLGCE